MAEPNELLVRCPDHPANEYEDVVDLAAHFQKMHGATVDAAVERAAECEEAAARAAKGGVDAAGAEGGRPRAGGRARRLPRGASGPAGGARDRARPAPAPSDPPAPPRVRVGGRSVPVDELKARRPEPTLAPTPRPHTTPKEVPMPIVRTCGLCRKPGHRRERCPTAAAGKPEKPCHYCHRRDGTHAPKCRRTSGAASPPETAAAATAESGTTGSPPVTLAWPGDGTVTTLRQARALCEARAKTYLEAAENLRAIETLEATLAAAGAAKV